MNQLIPCDSCQRHVRVSEIVCPFCDSALAPAPSSLPRAPGSRTRRGLAYALSAGLLGATAVGCTDDPEVQADAGMDVDAGADADAGPDASVDAGWPIPIYSAPPPLPGSSD